MFKKRTSFTPHTLNYPPIFKIRLVKLSELENLYADVLGSAPTGKVYECMINYVTSLVEPRDWRAIWRTTETGINSPGTVSDFIVTVLDVSHNALEATVTIDKLLYPTLEGDDCNEEERVAISSLLEKKIVNVSLTELYVINENDSDEYSVTAVVIEHIRFFYRHIWRPWDDVLTRPPIASFAESYLSDRLRLYFEIGHNTVSQHVVDRINYLVEEGTRLKARFDEVKNKMEAFNQGLEGGDWGTNEEITPNDFDLYESLRLQMKLEDFDLEMTRLEDPLLRNIMMIVDSKEIDDNERIHLIAIEFNLPLLEKIVSYLKSNPIIGANGQPSSHNNSAPLVFHQDLPSAFSAVRTGDKVLILPGTYACLTTLWITKDITVMGVGSTKDEVIIESSDPTGEIFLHCASDLVEISNVTFRTADSSQGLLQVHFGQTHLKKCTLDGGQCRTALSGQLFITECNIPHPFTLNESESSVKIKSSNLSDSLVCSRHST